METTISKWGNSSGVRIPKDVLARSGLKEGAAVAIEAEDGRVIISRPKTKKKYTLEELLAGTTPEEYRNALDPEFHEWWQSSVGREIIEDDYSSPPKPPKR
ncbi:MAG TPA: AbrB/MazE/SpoVT family DNA-binding domain-containing protein [Alphaproteobacteria bacterium]|nr:AbrB/MazE/SpoVT family DNA-binding domain-containing protein [Alphaproteobacteria bacterium]